jgi:putative colanic acid biosynthesis acetyltransferase WcaF
MRLDRFSSASFDRGASRTKEALWILANGVLLASWLPGSGWRRLLLSSFGARIGQGVVLKPRVNVKFPWRLEIGDHSWIGENVWIDNLARVSIGAHACVSQGAYLCTGSHDWSRESFDLIVLPITVGNHAWIGARSLLAPGTDLGEGAVLTVASLGKGKLAPWKIHSGNPARTIRPRVLR